MFKDRNGTTILGWFVSWRELGSLAAWVSIFWNIIEGVAALTVAIQARQLQLGVYGAQSLIEILASVLALWRLRLEFQSEGQAVSGDSLLRAEKRGMYFMGMALLSLGGLAIITGVWRLWNHDVPESSVLGVIVALLAAFSMLTLWLIKRRTAVELNSATLAADAQCSLYCFRDSILVVLGTIINWQQLYLSSLCNSFLCNLWWLDSVLAIIISVLCTRDGIRSVLAASSENFTGAAKSGCCGGDNMSLITEINKATTSGSSPSRSTVNNFTTGEKQCSNTKTISSSHITEATKLIQQKERMMNDATLKTDAAVDCCSEQSCSETTSVRLYGSTNGDEAFV